MTSPRQAIILAYTIVNNEQIPRFVRYHDIAVELETQGHKQLLEACAHPTLLDNFELYDLPVLIDCLFTLYPNMRSNYAGWHVAPYLLRALPARAQDITAKPKSVDILRYPGAANRKPQPEHEPYQHANQLPPLPALLTRAPSRSTTLNPGE